jgi:hypothetical protein
MTAAIEAGRAGNERLEAADRQREADLESERRAHAELQHAHAALLARWDTERSATTELRRLAAAAEDRAQLTIQELRDTLAHSHEEMQTLRQDLERTTSRLEELLGVRATLLQPPPKAPQKSAAKGAAERR